MKLVATLAVLVIASTAPALAVQDCKPVKEDKRVCLVAYDPDNVLRVWGTLRSMTMFVFGKDETNPRLAAADKNGLSVIPDGNVLIIKPKPVPPAWHMQPIMVLTTLKDGSVRPYLIEYNLQDNAPIDATSSTTAFKIQYTYPIQEAQEKAAAYRARSAVWREKQVRMRMGTTGSGAASGGKAMDCNYVEQHPQGQALPFIPTAACDDGQVTYLTFPGNMTVPTITIDGPDGKPMVPMQHFDPATSRQVIDTVARHFYLRIGDALVCLWKTGPVDPVGYNPGTYTSSPDVRRELKEPAR